ncbi:MAG TPA: multicopper oxidase domain-containing protein [Archangium sp.]|uniref:multicopper oxidase domain-containing protein n=1 Tax=Archangium sp. TaxID=1872627 RepID=UPI002E36C167|nr:multicopper oxidase domain-containing protein [Archangium sp.]HEX5751594.1 multicopper oxidase domain-containing protein [Archangium sp.]
MARNGWRLGVLLTLGLMGWEVGLLWLLSGGFGPRADALGSRLAWDAALLLPVACAAVGCAHWLSRRGGQDRSTVESAATLSVCFLLLLVPVATGRGLIQRELARTPPPAASEGQPVSATPQDVGDESRFLCAAVAPDLSASPEDPDGGSLAEASWAGVRDALVLQVPVFPLALLLRRRSRSVISGARAVVSPLALLIMVGASCAWESDGRRPAPDVSGLAEGEGGCAPGARVRTYAVAAVPVDLPLNPQGDHVPRGLMYLLEEARPALQEREPQPLVLRANAGECLVLRFTNRLPTEPAALRIEGLRATVRGPEGGFVPGTSVPPGQSLTYVLALPEAPEAEGAYLLHDSGDGGEREARGLFGALLVEPAGSVYRSTETGEPLRDGSGWEALIDVPSGQDFREMALLYHAMGPPEVADVRSARGEPLPLQDEMAGPFRPGAFGINYRSQPHFEREESPDDEDERSESPRRVAAPLQLRSYLGEPIKLRVLHAGSAEFHIHHLHAWRRGQRAKQAPASPFEAPQLLSPGSGLTLATSGAGDFPTAAGDFIVHCHLPNHSAGGEQFSWRVFDSPQPRLAPLHGTGNTGARD